MLKLFIKEICIIISCLIVYRMFKFRQDQQVLINPEIEYLPIFAEYCKYRMGTVHYFNLSAISINNPINMEFMITLRDACFISELDVCFICNYFLITNRQYDGMLLADLVYDVHLSKDVSAEIRVFLNLASNERPHEMIFDSDFVQEIVAELRRRPRFLGIDFEFD